MKGKKLAQSDAIIVTVRTSGVKIHYHPSPFLHFLYKALMPAAPMQAVGVET